MKKIGSLSHRRPYVYSFYLNTDISHDYLHEKFPCMTQVEKRNAMDGYAPEINLQHFP